MSKRDALWRIVTSKFSYVKRGENFFTVCENALKTAAEQNVTIHGIFEIDAFTMRRRLANHELKRFEDKAQLDKNSNL